MPLNLYKISQETVNGYDTFSDAVVAAPDEAFAARIHPENIYPWRTELTLIPQQEDWNDSWTNNPADVRVEFLGVSAAIEEPCVICASFHAG